MHVLIYYKYAMYYLSNNEKINSLFWYLNCIVNLKQFSNHVVAILSIIFKGLT